MRLSDFETSNFQNRPQLLCVEHSENWYDQFRAGVKNFHIIGAKVRVRMIINREMFVRIYCEICYYEIWFQH
jgi:hypothetical protein